MTKMLQLPTVDLLHELRLTGMAQSIEGQLAMEARAYRVSDKPVYRCPLNRLSDRSSPECHRSPSKPKRSVPEH